MWFLMGSEQNKLVLLHLENVVLCRAPLQQHHVINIKIYDIFYRCQKKIVGLAIWIIVFNHITVLITLWLITPNLPSTHVKYTYIFSIILPSAVHCSTCIIYIHVFMHAQTSLHPTTQLWPVETVSVTSCCQTNTNCWLVLSLDPPLSYVCFALIIFNMATH